MTTAPLSATTDTFTIVQSTTITSSRHSTDTTFTPTITTSTTKSIKNHCTMSPSTGPTRCRNTAPTARTTRVTTMTCTTEQTMVRTPSVGESWKELLNCVNTWREPQELSVSSVEKKTKTQPAGRTLAGLPGRRTKRSAGSKWNPSWLI